MLIYADFRVKSSRNSDGAEVVHFYTLDDAFQVILDKLDNVDEAKEHRYRKVYNKLKDFEDYMKALGVDTVLPQIPVKEPPAPTPAEGKDAALASGNETAREYKYAAIDHNIRLMNKFNREEDFERLHKLLEELPQRTPVKIPVPEVALPQCGSLTLRQALLGEKELVAAENLEGRICACVKSPCPPGIPLVVPGERIDARMCCLLKNYGISSLQTVAER